MLLAVFVIAYQRRLCDASDQRIIDDQWRLSGIRRLYGQLSRLSAFLASPCASWLMVSCACKSTTKSLKMLSSEIARCNGGDLLGCQWLQAINLTTR